MHLYHNNLSYQPFKITSNNQIYVIANILYQNITKCNRCFARSCIDSLHHLEGVPFPFFVTFVKDMPPSFAINSAFSILIHPRPVLLYNKDTFHRFIADFCRYRYLTRAKSRYLSIFIHFCNAFIGRLPNRNVALIARKL